MAIAYSSTSAMGQGNATAVNASMTVGSLTNGYLLVGLVYQNTTGSPTSLKWNTTETMTLLAGPYDITGAGAERIFIYGLANPTAATTNITCAKSADGIYVTFWGAAYSGVDQASQPDSTGQNLTAGATTLTVSTTVVAANSWLFGCYRFYGSAPTAGTNTVLRGTDTAASISDSNSDQAAGSRDQVVNQTGSNGIGGLIVSFDPVAAAGPANLKSLDTNTKSNIKSYNTNLIANVKSINTNV